MKKNKFIDKEDVRSGCDLRDYAASKNPLLKQSDETFNLTGQCPSCGRSRSFVVYDDGFYCHACGYSGDCFDYIMQEEDCSFYDALRLLGG